MTTDSHSYIRVGRDGQPTSYVGPAATSLYQAMVIRSALGLIERGIRPNTRYTLSATLKTASAITGYPYSPRKSSIPRARQDLWDWCERTKSTIPVIKDQ